MTSLKTLSPFDLKLISVAVVSIGCSVSGILPVYLGLGSRHSNSLAMSAALCFGGGVLLSTSVVHILAEIAKDIPEYSSLVYCIGFLLIYFLDTVVQTTTAPPINRPSPLLVDSQSSYGAIGQADDVHSSSGSSISSGNTDIIHRNGSPFNCVNFNLLLAFSIHSLLEGLVIGVEKTSRGVILLLMAICSHKIVVAFCLGAEIGSNACHPYQVIPPLAIFVLGSDLGIVLGAFVNPEYYSNIPALISVLQGLAGGTLLYVVVSEILPRERRRFTYPVANFVQFGFVTFGFSLMTVLNSLY